MTYRVVVDPPADRELQKLPRREFRVAIESITALAVDPRPSTAGNLTGVAHGMKLRVGNYRVLYTVEDAARTVRIFRVQHRGSVYRDL